jgi:DNA-binding IclR family transcriptional regulator
LATEEPRYLIEPVARAIDVLRLLSSTFGPIRLKDITAATKLSKATSFRYLKTFSLLGVLRQVDDGISHRIDLDFADMLLRAAAVEHLRRVSVPHMTRLSKVLGCTVNVGILDGTQVLYVDILEVKPSHRMRARVGGGDPIHTTALGKAILANLATELQLNALPAVLRKRTSSSIADKNLLLLELDAIKRNGFAEDRGENEDGSICLGSPIFFPHGDVAGAISLSGPAGRTEQWRTKAIAAVTRAASAISDDYGVRLRRALTATP